MITMVQEKLQFSRCMEPSFLLLSLLIGLELQDLFVMETTSSIFYCDFTIVLPIFTFSYFLATRISLKLLSKVALIWKKELLQKKGQRGTSARPTN